MIQHPAARNQMMSGLIPRKTALMACLLLAACGTLPRAVPTSARIEASGASDHEDGLNRLIVPLTVPVASASRGTGPSGFPAAWTGAGTIDPSHLGPGDMIEVSVWEPTDRPLIGGTDGGGGKITAEVARDGMVRLPFTQPVTATGRTPDQLASDIATAMSAMSADAQAAVHVLQPKSRQVTVQGNVTRAGVYPIETATLHLSGILAQAGGVASDPDEMRVSVTRGGKTGSVGLADLYTQAKLDLALRTGDRIVVRPIDDRYIVLGASGGQAELAFRGSNFTLMQALAQAGGLRDSDADPKGIYLFRYEPEATAQALLGPTPAAGFPSVNGRRPVVYRLDMTEPSALFAARSFRMRDGDMIVATNAPLTELRKIASIFSTVIQPANEATYLQNR